MRKRIDLRKILESSLRSTWKISCYFTIQLLPLAFVSWSCAVQSRSSFLSLRLSAFCYLLKRHFDCDLCSEIFQQLAKSHQHSHQLIMSAFDGACFFQVASDFWIYYCFLHVSSAEQLFHCLVSSLESTSLQNMHSLANRDFPLDLEKTFFRPYHIQRYLCFTRILCSLQASILVSSKASNLSHQDSFWSYFARDYFVILMSSKLSLSLLLRKSS